MHILVSREACCSQDDQLGPLEHIFDLAIDATLIDLVNTVVKSSFLQYSSSHTSMVGAFGATPVARVFSPHGDAKPESEFLLSPTLRVAELVALGELRFRFQLREVLG